MLYVLCSYFLALLPLNYYFNVFFLVFLELVFVLMITVYVLIVFKSIKHTLIAPPPKKKKLKSTNNPTKELYHHGK